MKQPLLTIASLATLLSLLPTARPEPFDPAADPRLGQERAANLAAFRRVYLQEKEALIAHHAGQWLVIVGGTVLPMHDGTPRPTADLDRVLREAQALAPQALHRFVFRVGEEGEVVYRASMSEAPNLAGARFSAYLSGDLWITPTGTYVAPHGAKLEEQGKRIGDGTDDKGGPRLSVTALSPEQTAAKSGEQVELRIATGFGGYVLLAKRHAETLGLHRFEIPGSLILDGHPQPLIRSRAVFRHEGGGLDALLPVGLR